MQRFWMIGFASALLFGATACQGAFEGGNERGDEVQIDGELTIQQAWATGAFSGDLGIRASWVGSADLDLFVETPEGETFSYKMRSGRSGGKFTKNACRAASCRSQTSEEVSFLDRSPEGTYTIWVERYDSKPVEDLVIEVSRVGAIDETLVPVIGGSAGDASERMTVDIEELPIESVYAGELGIQLAWDGGADLDLMVLNPAGEQIFYGRRTDSTGGRFTKGDCLLTRCQHSGSEEVRWDSTASMGNYEVRISNYNGGSAANVKVYVHKHRQIIETHEVSVPSRRGATVGPVVVDYQTVPLTPNGVQLDSHQDEQWLRGTSHELRAHANDPNVVHAELVINGRNSGEASGDSWSFDANFSQLGQQSVEIRGYSADGMLVAIDRKTLVVTDQNNGLPNRGTGARDVSRQLLAKRILELPGIELTTLLPSGVRDNLPADSLSNIRDAVMGTSRTSCYGNANCTDVYLDERLLHAMVMINQRDGLDYRITTLAGGSHSSRSRHYAGIAMDVNYINGTKVSRNTPTNNGRLTRLCRSMGATEVIAPPSAGHSGHIHCAWPR